MTELPPPLTPYLETGRERSWPRRPTRIPGSTRSPRSRAATSCSACRATRACRARTSTRSGSTWTPASGARCAPASSAPRAPRARCPWCFYIHGAGWVFGDDKTHDRLFRELVVGAGAAGVFPVYDRGAGREVPHPGGADLRRRASGRRARRGARSGHLADRDDR
ncbi:lipase [Streptomyces sp. e14]|nr:lipase [Streptomyces sp. e14]